MTTHRRYLFQHPEPWTQTAAYPAIRRVLHRAGEYWWFNDLECVGEELELLVITFTVSARDQWFAHTRAMRLAIDCYYAAGLNEDSLPEPIWETLEPSSDPGGWGVKVRKVAHEEAPSPTVPHDVPQPEPVRLG
jgi:hypothetical protein